MPGRRDYDQLLAEFESATYEQLRPAQSQTLAAYSANHSEDPDVGIELPTGAGKSLIALLIAEAWLQEGKTAVVLTANKTLARQMEQHADALGVDVKRLEGRRDQMQQRDLRAIQRGAAIGVMNYWVYINQAPAVDPASLVVMDDAHLAEGSLNSLYSLEINRFDHPALFERLADELAARLPHYVSLIDAAGGERHGPGVSEVISFDDQRQVEDQLRQVIASFPLPEDLSFRWSRISRRLGECVLIASRHSFWLRPWVYPLQTNAHYHQVEQRLYMSATIGDPADLARRLGTARIEMVDTGPGGDETLGRRLIVLDKTNDQQASAAAFEAALRIRHKSVWLCPSRSEVERIAPLVAQVDQRIGEPFVPTWRVTGTGDEVDAFKAADRGHLFAAGRFDGMDFHGDECRLVAMPDLPRAVNPLEEFVSQQLGGGHYLIGRINARIVQALGRANRSDNDYAVYLLGDARFVSHFARESFRRSLPRAVNAEIDLAQDLSDELPNAVAAQVARFLHQDFADYDEHLAETTYGAPAPQPRPDWSEPLARLEIDGWHELWQGRYAEAERLFGRWSDGCRDSGLAEMSAFARWCQAKAAYLAGLQGDQPSAVRAERLLDQAIRDGGRFTTWFNGLRASLNTMRAQPAETDVQTVDGAREQTLRGFDDFLVSRGDDPQRFEGWRARTDADLRSGTHARCQQALEEIGELLGYRAVRPRRGSATTDVRWTGSFAGSREMICLELKIEHEPHHAISAGMVDQALGQVASAAAEWGPRGFQPRGAIVTHLPDADPEAVTRLGGMPLIRHDAVCALWERLALLLGLFRETWSPDDAAARQAAAARVAPHLPDTGWLIRAFGTGDPWVDTDRLLADWPAPPG